MSNGPVFEAGPGWGKKLGTWMSRNWIYVLPGVAILVLILVLSSQGNDTTDDLTLVTASPSASTSLSPTNGQRITVVTRDSYTTVARKAITEHTKNSSDIMPGQVVYAETIIAQKIQNQPLVVGSSIEISHSLIDETLANFSSLSAYQQQRWAQYRR